MRYPKLNDLETRALCGDRDATKQLVMIGRAVRAEIDRLSNSDLSDEARDETADFRDTVAGILEVRA